MTHEVAPAMFVIHEVAAVREAIQGVWIKLRLSHEMSTGVESSTAVAGRLVHSGDRSLPELSSSFQLPTVWQNVRR